MTPPSKPLDEAERLREILRYDILDSAPEVDFDAVTRFVAAACSMPIAAISFIDADRQWFKSIVGIEVERTARDDSFCAHAILDPGDATIVPDAVLDERFRNNPFVIGHPFIRFYAGIPLLSRAGHALGTLCVLDTTPRTLTADQESALRMAARTAEILLEQRRTTSRLESEIAARDAVEDRLAFSSSHDGLTSLPNRQAFMSGLDVALRRLHEKRGQRFAVAFIDLDRFKDINDTLGHLAGDALLVEVGRRFTEMTRPHDAVARLGGDEFTMALDGVTSIAEVDAVAVRIANVLASRLTLRGGDFDVTASVGFVLVDETYTTAEEIMRDADIAMYAAKERGRNCCAVFTPQIRDRFNSATDLDRALRVALDRNEFWLAYQPIVSLDGRSTRPTSFEALLRWKNSAVSSIGAAQFIEAAERTGLIVELGYWVLREACAQACRWPSPDGSRVTTAVNVSPKQLAEPGFCSDVKRIVRESGLDPQLLALEVTESILIIDAAASLAIIEELRAFGIKIYLDDFGTGYSSFRYLRSFPFDRIKIDRSFVSGVDEGLTDTVIVNSIISLAHQLDIAVIAEGVETERQRDALIALGCDSAQGFLFSRAIPADEAVHLLVPERAA